MLPIEDKYKQLKNPSNLVKHFKDDAEFIEWCNEGTIEDLYYTLEAFKVAQLYWYCLLISNVIREKKEEEQNAVRYPIAPSIYFDGMLFWTLGEIVRLGDLEFVLTYN